jgi:beta-xylosidase
MSSDGLSVLDAGKTIVEDRQNLPVLEGPKMYKREGHYYIFAPYGGVDNGPQAVMRSDNIWGPYEFRTVLEQGKTTVNGPHQGGYVETPTGGAWFLHFHREGAYGRIVYLEPVQWHEGWPVVGEADAPSHAGTPVAEWAKPVASVTPTLRTPLTSDEFSEPRLAFQWEWNHNPDDGHWSLTERSGFLRLKAMTATDLLGSRNTLTEVPQDRDFQVTIQADTSRMVGGQHAGLAMFSEHPSWIEVVQNGSQRELKFGAKSGSEQGGLLNTNMLQLRVSVRHEIATYSYSTDSGLSFRTLGTPQQQAFGWWKGIRPAIFTYNTAARTISAGLFDIDWVHYNAM